MPSTDAASDPICGPRPRKPFRSRALARPARDDGRLSHTTVLHHLRPSPSSPSTDTVRSRPASRSVLRQFLPTRLPPCHPALADAPSATGELSSARWDGEFKALVRTSPSISSADQCKRQGSGRPRGTSLSRVGRKGPARMHLPSSPRGIFLPEKGLAPEQGSRLQHPHTHPRRGPSRDPARTRRPADQRSQPREIQRQTVRREPSSTPSLPCGKSPTSTSFILQAAYRLDVQHRDDIVEITLSGSKLHM